VPGLAELPFVGPAFFRQHPMVYLTVRADFGAGLVPLPLARRAGAACGGRIAGVGACAGYPVRRIRMAAVVAGARAVRAAGAYLSVIYTPLWVEGMVAGRGWIALALTTFATWRPGAPCCSALTSSAASRCCSSTCRARASRSRASS